MARITLLNYFRLASIAFADISDRIPRGLPPGSGQLHGGGAAGPSRAVRWQEQGTRSLHQHPSRE